MKKPTERQWTAFRLIYQEGKTQEEAAKEMGISQGNISGIIARLKLRIPGFEQLFPELTGRKKIFQFRHSDEDNIAEKF